LTIKHQPSQEIHCTPNFHHGLSDRQVHHIFQEHYEEQNVIENKTFEKVSSLELKQQLLDYLNNSVKTRTTFNNAEMNYDLGMQEILRPQIQTFGEEMIVVRSKMDANNIMAFYKENGVIENCLIIECAQNAEDALEETMFTCYDSNNIPIFNLILNNILFF